MFSLRSLLPAVGLVAALGCDEPPKPAPLPNASAAAAPAPEPEPAAEAKPAAKKPRKSRADCPKSGDVTLEPSELLAQVRLKLQKPTGTITRADLGKLRSLNLASVKLDELDPCLFALTPNLKELFLGQGEIDDLSPIAELEKLESLRASINPIRDLAPLAKMKKLDRLDLGRTQVQSLTPLAELTSLTELALDDAPVSDLSPLANLKKLERLSLQRTRVKDLTPLKGLESLRFLYLQETPAADDTSALAPLRAKGLKIFEL